MLNFEKIDHHIGILKKRHFFAGNWGKSQKIVIINIDPGFYHKNIMIDQTLYCSTKG
jgi:hypothetical protein